MLATLARAGSRPALWGARTGPGSFYAVVPWGIMAGLAGAAIAWAVVSMTVSTGRFWGAIGPGIPALALWRGLGPALRDIVTLRHLDGGGPGCNDAGLRFSGRRRTLHHIMAAGVVLAFAATLAAAIDEDVFGRMPPYALASFPVGLGVAGGLAIVVGVAGLLALEARSDRAPSDRGEALLNVVFLIVLGVAAVSGLALVAARETAAMGPLLVFHISVVVGLFVGLPAAKSLHAPFRAAALLRAAAERRDSQGRPGARGGAAMSD